MGQRLKPYQQVDTEKGRGMKEFYEGIFQTVKGGDAAREPGKLINSNPTQDNLSLTEMAKSQALKNNDLVKVKKIMENEILEKNLTIEDVIDEMTSKQLSSKDPDGPKEKFMN